MNREEQKLHKIVKHLDGLHKIDAYDLLQKVEVVLFYASSPLKTNDLKQIINVGIDNNHDIDPLHFTVLPNGNFCEFIDANDWLHIYKEQKRGIGRWGVFDTYHFKIKYAPLELIKLTKKNLLESFQDTAEEVEMIDFISKNRRTKKEEFIKKLLDLDLGFM